MSKKIWDLSNVKGCNRRKRLDRTLNNQNCKKERSAPGNVPQKKGHVFCMGSDGTMGERCLGNRKKGRTEGWKVQTQRGSAKRHGEKKRSSTQKRGGTRPASHTVLLNKGKKDRKWRGSLSGKGSNLKDLRRTKEIT